MQRDCLTTSCLPITSLLGQDKSFFMRHLCWIFYQNHKITEYYLSVSRPVMNVTDAVTVKFKLKLSQLIDVVRSFFLKSYYFLQAFCAILMQSNATYLNKYWFFLWKMSFEFSPNKSKVLYNVGILQESYIYNLHKMNIFDALAFKIYAKFLFRICANRWWQQISG